MNTSCHIPVAGMIKWAWLDILLSPMVLLHPPRSCTTLINSKFYTRSVHCPMATPIRIVDHVMNSRPYRMIFVVVLGLPDAR